MGTGRQIADYALGAYECKGGYIFGTQGIEWTPVPPEPTPPGPDKKPTLRKGDQG